VQTQCAVGGGRGAAELREARQCLVDREFRRRRINGFNATTGAFIGPMHYGQSTPGFQGKPVVIDGLWALKVGNDHNGKSGYANTLYFTAGPNDEADGLFGALRPDGLYGTPPYPFPGP
jgi:hypothetical protein